MLTRERLTALDEAQLRTDVLIPLFRAMRFRDVVHYHGGPQERGKDVVMWRPNALGRRVNVSSRVIFPTS